MKAICLIGIIAVSFVISVQAQKLFPDYIVPADRGASGAEYSEWDMFSSAEDPNSADVAAAASDPTLTQTASGAFLTSGFNIYSFSGPLAFELANDTSGTIGAVNNVVFQFETLGTFIDFDSIFLNYDNGSGIQSIAATNFITESRVITGGFGGFTNRTAVQWDLSGLNIANYTITFESLGSSTSFAAAVLDASSSAYSEIVPSARTWDGGGGTNKWSNANNWSNNTITAAGGNVTFNGVSSVELDSNRTVGEMVIKTPGGFSLTNSGGAILTINTGITATPASGQNYSISVPIFMGGHNFMNIGAGTTLTISGVISGAGSVNGLPATGIYKEGDGMLVLTGNNTFGGGVIVDGGELVVSGSNSYSGATGINQGRFVVKNNAPNGAAGALGNATSNVALGVDPATYGLLAEAALLIEGDFTVARNIAVASGAQDKRLGARSTASGAIFSGNVTLASTSSNVILSAANATDRVTFTGQISGGGTGNTLRKDGAGTVVFAGANKTYNNATNVAAGRLVIQSGTSSTGNGSWTVASGAKLEVNGTLGGSGALTVNGTLSGSGTVSKSFTIASGAVLSPGNSPGTMNTLTQTWAGGGNYLWELNSAGGSSGSNPGWDLANINGALNITATAGSTFEIDVVSLTLANTAGLVADFNQNADYSWKIAQASSGITGFDASKFSINTAGFANAFSGTWSLTVAGNEMFLNYQSVPEPSSMLLIGIGAAAFWSCRRRRSPL